MFALLNRGQLNKGYTVNDQSILNLTQGFFWLSLVIGTFSFAYSMNLCIKLLQRRESVVASWICLGLHIALTLYALLPIVRKFYANYMDPSRHEPFYRPSSRV